MSGALLHSRGVSLIELVFAMVILLAIIFIGVPSLRDWMQNAQIRTAAEALQNALQLARNEAVKRNQLVALRLDDPTGGRAVWQVCVWDKAASGCDGATEEPLARLQSESRTANARIAATDKDALVASHAAFASPLSGMAGDAVVFNGVGRLEPDTGSVVRVDVANPSLPEADQRRLAVWISQGGQVKLCDPQLPEDATATACP